MLPITFEIPGKPFAKQRPKFSRASGRAYTPSQTVSYERQVAAIATEHFDAPIEGAVHLRVVSTFEPAKSWSKKKTAAHIGLHHTQKPDLDNCIKAIKDALNRIAWADDSQVASVEAVKVWGPTERTIVTVRRIGPNVQY